MLELDLSSWERRVEISISIDSITEDLESIWACRSDRVLEAVLTCPGEETRRVLLED